MISFSNEQITALDKQYRICLINSLLGYKSLNLVGTANREGVTNLCVISSAFHLGANPALIGLVMRPQRDNNDTLRNIKSTGCFTLNNVLPSWYMQAHQTSASYPLGVSEFETCGFNPYYIADFKPPFVAESSVKIGLELREVLDIKMNDTTIVVAEIVHILVNDALIGEDGTLDHVSAETVTAAGLDAYFLTKPLGRLAYAKPDKAPRLIENAGSLRDQ
jgi:flavin reductase (DIM6/NTAB) family NADH-FMN oxidoreductase RutF